MKFFFPVLLLAALAGLGSAQSIYVPDNGTPILDTLTNQDPAVGASCLLTVKSFDFVTGHTFGCLGTPGSQVWVDLTAAAALVPSVPPATSSSPGVTGTITWDANYEYICVAPSSWKRAALASF